MKPLNIITGIVFILFIVVLCHDLYLAQTKTKILECYIENNVDTFKCKILKADK